MNTDAVDDIGQGRVWSGYDAKKIGLVDIYGGLEKAISTAAALAELDDFRVISLPKQEDPVTQIINDLKQTSISDILINDFDFNVFVVSSGVGIINLVFFECFLQ